MSIDEESANEQRAKNGTNYQPYWIKNKTNFTQFNKECRVPI